jgi:DNA-binding NtrC family response regulator
MKRYVLFVDDDFDLVKDLADEIRFYLRQHDVHLLIAFGLVDVKSIISTLKDGVIELAIIDLWMNDKDTIIPDHEAGRKALGMIRKRFRNCYGVVHSAHLDTSIIAHFESEPRIAILVKPIPTRQITDILGKVLKFESA